MTKRETYLRALRRQPVDRLVWAPNLDYWLAVNRAEGTVPEPYRDLSRNDIVRAIGGTIWNRAEGMRAVRDASVREVWRDEPGARVHELHTPVGAIREAYLPTEGVHRSPYRDEHFLKTVEDVVTMRYVVEATHFEPNYEPTVRALAETGDDGVVLNSACCVPFIQYAKTDAGYATAYYLWTDHRAEVDALVQAYQRLFLQGYGVLAAGPADVIASDDNMDELTMPPRLFREYAIPYFQAAAEVVTPSGKLFEAHWCGRTQKLLPLTPGCGLNVVEAIVTRPMADIGLAEAIDMLRGEVAFQGGIPSVLVCAEGGTRADFERYIAETILPLKGRPGYVLGMSDNTPPNADFARMEAVAGLIA